MAINFPNDPATNPGNGGQWTDPGGSGTWEVEIINGEAIWTLVSTSGGGGNGGAVSLNELNDVTLSNPQDTNVLQYNTSTGQWINAPAPTAGNVNLNDLGDVDTSAGTTGDVLVKQSNGNWEAQTPANTGGIGEAPEDGTPYVRQDATWISMPDNGGGATLNIDEAPADGVAYTRKDNSWVPGVQAVTGSTAQIEGDNNIDTGTNTRAVTTGHVLTYDGTKFAPAALPADNVGIGEAPNDGKQYGRQSEGWTEITATGGGPATTDDLTEGTTNKYFPEAPNDGKQYARESEGWTEVVASGGGGGDVEEAPLDDTLYARKNGEWTSLENTGELVYGKLSTSGLPTVTNYETEAAATSDGYTVLDFSGVDDSDDGVFGVQLPAAFTDVSWFGEKDPDTDTAGYQTIWVNGNGYASFMPLANAESPEIEAYPIFLGYDPVFSYMDAQNLLFGFHNIDTVLDMVCTKEVGNYFVIHIQWADEYDYFFTEVGGAADAGFFPYAPYDPSDPNQFKRKKRAKNPKTAASSLITGELWLGKDGSVRMAYGPCVSAISMVEDVRTIGFSQQTSGIYKKGVPVTEVMGSVIDFKTFGSNNLIYGPDQTNDGANVSGPSDLLDWYINYVPASTPFLLDAPNDGAPYVRQSGQWVAVGSPPPAPVVTGFWNVYADNNSGQGNPDFPGDGYFRVWSSLEARFSCTTADGTDITEQLSSLKEGDTVYIRKAFDPDTGVEEVTNLWRPFEITADAQFADTLGKPAAHNFYQLTFGPTSPWDTTGDSPDILVRWVPETALGYYWEIAFGGIPEGGTLLPHSSYVPPVTETPDGPSLGDGIGEAPEDGFIYGRRNKEWVNLEQPSGVTTYGRLKASALPGVTSYESQLAATNDGFTQVVVTNVGDGFTAVQLPEAWTNTTWFGLSDPDKATNGYQTLWVNGYGYAVFSEETYVQDFLQLPNTFGYDPTNSLTENYDLLFGFFNAQTSLDMICTKEVDNYFVIHIQWDASNNFVTSVGEGDSGGIYPYPPYDPNLNPFAGPPVKRDVSPKTAETELLSVELWLGKDGSVRMAYGSNSTAIGLYEDAKNPGIPSGLSEQTAGIYKRNGVPVVSVMGSTKDFKEFAATPLVYGLDQTEDGALISDPAEIFDWYMDYNQFAGITRSTAMDLIAAINKDPELKAAFKLALAD